MSRPAALPKLPESDDRRDMKLQDVPIGTRAPAIRGGAWWKTDRGWKWNGPESCGDTFPTPGGDWTGRLIYTLVIANWRPLRLNDMLYRNRYSVARRKLADKNLIAGEAMAQRITRADGPRRVSLNVVLTGRQKAADPDAYWKSLLDGLVGCGLLKDDSARYCTLGPVTFERGDRTRTEITLEDL